MKYTDRWQPILLQGAHTQFLKNNSTIFCSKFPVLVHTVIPLSIPFLFGHHRPVMFALSSLVKVAFNGIHAAFSYVRCGIFPKHNEDHRIWNPIHGKSNIHKITHLIHQEPLISIGCGPNPMVVLDWIVERERAKDTETYANELRISPSLSIVVSTRWSHVTLTRRDYRSFRRNWRRKGPWESNETAKSYHAFFAPDGD